MPLSSAIGYTRKPDLRVTYPEAAHPFHEERRHEHGIQPTPREARCVGQAVAHDLPVGSLPGGTQERVEIGDRTPTVSVKRDHPRCSPRPSCCDATAQGLCLSPPLPMPNDFRPGPGGDRSATVVDPSSTTTTGAYARASLTTVSSVAASLKAGITTTEVMPVAGGRPQSRPGCCPCHAVHESRGG